MTSYIESVIKSKLFRKLSPNAKLIFLYLSVQSSSCGVIEFDCEESDFTLRISGSDACMDELVKKGLCHHDPGSGEVFFHDYLRYQNPATGSVAHKVKFKADHASIKSEAIKELVDSALEQAKKIAARPQSAPIDKRHHIDH